MAPRLGTSLLGAAQAAALVIPTPGHAQETPVCTPPAVYRYETDAGPGDQAEPVWVFRTGIRHDDYAGDGSDLPGFVLDVARSDEEGHFTLHGPARSFMFVGPSPDDLEGVTWDASMGVLPDGFGFRSDDGQDLLATLRFIRCEPSPLR